MLRGSCSAIKRATQKNSGLILPSMIFSATFWGIISGLLSKSYGLTPSQDQFTLYLWLALYLISDTLLAIRYIGKESVPTTKV